MKKQYSRNQPIFLWDGTPIHTGVKPSIGADHRFMKGYFKGQHGRKGLWHMAGQGRRYGTVDIPQIAYAKASQFNLDPRSTKIYEPMSLWDIQRMVDLGRLDSSKVIDITAIINARAMKPSDFLWSEDIMGIRLVSDGLNEFDTALNIEFQMADKDAIAAVERAGGRFTAAFFDRRAIEAAVNPVDYFLRGEPVRKRLLPPDYLLPFYVSPETRGYLADVDLVQDARISLAQEYGFEPRDFSSCHVMNKTKDPRQIWFGVEPGSLVNLQDRTVHRPHTFKEHEVAKENKTVVQQHIES